MRHILLLVTGSEESLRAVEYGIELAKEHRCRLSAVFVIDTATLKELELSKIFIDEESRDYAGSLEENGKRYLNYVTKRAKERKVSVETALRKGRIYAETIRHAKEIRADVILTGSKQALPGRKCLIARENADLVKNSPIPVLIHKAGAGR